MNYTDIVNCPVFGEEYSDHVEESPPSGSWWYVYRLESIKSPDHGYTGITSNLQQRLHQHNSGKNTSTQPFAPYRVLFAAAFPDKKRALAFESYLKTGSGLAFANKRLF